MKQVNGYLVNNNFYEDIDQALIAQAEYDLLQISKDPYDIISYIALSEARDMIIESIRKSKEENK